jgi:DNA-binding MarR family transcriptional regulator
MSQFEAGRPEKLSISQEDALEIGRLLRLLAPTENTVTGLIRGVRSIEGRQAPSRSIDSRRLMSIAREMYVRRRARERHFDSNFFGEPAWDILLALYSTGDDGARQSVKGVVDFASCPPTTALRYLTALEQDGLIERRPSPTDGRVFYISLSEKGRGSIENYLRSVLELGHA